MPIDFDLLNAIYKATDNRLGDRWVIGQLALAAVRAGCPQVLSEYRQPSTKTICGMPMRESVDIPPNEIHFHHRGKKIGTITT